MKTEVKKLSRGDIEVTIELTPAEYQPFLESAAQKISQNMTVKGFRPGKATYDLIEKHVGRQEVWQQALEPAVMRTLANALNEHKIQSVGQPNIEVIKLAPDNPVIYKATVAVLPDVMLGDLAKIKVDKKEIKADEAKLKQSLEYLQKMHSKETLVDRVAQKSDKVELDFDVFIDKVPIDNGAQKKFPLVLGEGNFIPGFEEQIVGLKSGDEKEFQLEFPKEYHQKLLAGKPADFKVKIHGVYQVELPEFNDQLAKSLGGFNSFKDLEDQLRKNLEAEAQTAENRRFEEELLEKIIAQSKFGDIPELLVDAEVKKMVDELKHSVSHQGIAFEEYLVHLKKTQEQLMLDFTPQAVKRVKSALVLRAVAQQDNISVTDQELEDEIQKNLVQYAGNSDAEKQLRKPDYKEYLRNVLASKKIIEHLKAKVVQ